MQQTIRYLRRKNLGNFEHEELEINDVVAEGAEIKGAIMGVKALVQECLYTDVPMNKSVQTPPPATGKTATTTKVTKEAKVTTVEKENPKKDEPTVSEEKPQTEVKVDETVAATTATETNPATETPAAAPDKKEEKEAKPKVQKETKVVAKKTNVTIFNRDLEPHKNNLGAWLDVKYPGWRKPEMLKKCGTVSRALHMKQEFLDAEGNILESFKEEFSKQVDAL